MSFHSGKYSVLRITTSKRCRRETNYFLHCQRLQVTDSAKYIGVTIGDDLQWEDNTQATAATASRTIGFLTYKYMVLPTMEYASTSWDPCTVEDDIIIIVLTMSNVALHIILATIIQSEPQGASQQCLASL